MPLNCGVWKDSCESLGQQGDQTSQLWRKSILNIRWKDWCWSWSSDTLATWIEELTHWKRPWCWERLRAGGEGGNRGWDGQIASPTQWTWVWANSAAAAAAAAAAKLLQSCPTLCNPMNCRTAGLPVITNCQSLPKLMSIESVMPSHHLLLCRPLLLLPSVLPGIGVFSNESILCIRWPKYWSFSFSISLFNEYSGLISFRIDWFDLLIW